MLAFKLNYLAGVCKSEKGFHVLSFLPLGGDLRKDKTEKGEWEDTCVASPRKPETNFEHFSLNIFAKYY